MSNEYKKQRKFWATDQEYELLKQKSLEHFQGKGYLSRYLVKIARAEGIIILEGNIKGAKIKISQE